MANMQTDRCDGASRNHAGCMGPNAHHLWVPIPVATVVVAVEIRRTPHGFPRATTPGRRTVITSRKSDLIRSGLPALLDPSWLS
jgi:hypothetical protein